MAEYYPLLAKAVASLASSTPDTRRVVYERARKALIGQLRTLHPPVPDEDIERESVALDRAVERLETELANGTFPAAPPRPSTPAPSQASVGKTEARESAAPAAPLPLGVPTRAPSRPASILPAGAGEKPLPPLRTKAPTARSPSARAGGAAPTAAALAPAADPDAGTVAGATSGGMGGSATAAEEVQQPVAEAAATRSARHDGGRIETQRPSAPLPPVPRPPARRLWIVPLVLVVVVAAVAVAAWKLRDHRVVVAKARPDANQQPSDNGKIAERVGGAASTEGAGTAAPATAAASSPAAEPAQPNPAPQGETPQSAAAPVAAPAPAGTAEVPVAQRAALLVEAPQEQSKVKTFLGHVVWKLNNVSAGGPNDPVGLAVEADIDVPEDKMRVMVTFEKNTDPSLPASHTIKVRFIMQAGSYTGDVQKISVPQMRAEAVANGEPLVGVTVPVVTNSFLVGLSPGSAEASNLKLLKELQWVDIPMLLSDGKIAKLTFEKGAAGQRDIDEALTSWQK